MIRDRIQAVPSKWMPLVVLILILAPLATAYIINIWWVYLISAGIFLFGAWFVWSYETDQPEKPWSLIGMYLLLVITMLAFAYDGFMTEIVNRLDIP